MRHAAALLIGVCVALANGSAAAPEAAVPVLVELFTAEGCSSCPPADTLLEKMIEAQPASGAAIVGLGEHVDYWDRLGWKDRFSSAAFTARQQRYAARAKSDDVYTPQMVVDGQEAFVGNDVNALRRAVERAIAAPHGAVRLALDGPEDNVVKASVTISSLPALSPGDRADIMVAVTEDHLQTAVKNGENKGRTLTHAAVVRELRTVGDASSPAAPAAANIKIAPDWVRAHLKVVAFVQERTSRRVLGTAWTALPLRP